MDNKAMHTLSYGLFVLTAKDGEKDNGCITNTAMQAASEPNTITFCINKANLTHDMVKEAGKCTVSVISEEAEFELFKRFGFQSGRDADKFDGFTAVERGGNGIYHGVSRPQIQILQRGLKGQDLSSKGKAFPKAQSGYYPR